MKKITLDRNCPPISPIGFGCMGLGGRFSPVDSAKDRHKQLISLVYDSGVNFFDTAEVYSSGLAEEILGGALHEVRSEVVIASKFSPENSSYEGVISSLDASLKRLNSDYIDLYQIHWPNYAVPLAETLEAMADSVRQGKVRCIGVSNFDAGELLDALRILPPGCLVSNQYEYSFFDRSADVSILPICKQNNIKLIAYSPLNQGYDMSLMLRNEMGAIAAKYGCTVPQLTLNWLYTYAGVLPIPHSSSFQHVKENSGSLDFELSFEDGRSIDELTVYTPLLVDPNEIDVIPDDADGRQIYRSLDDARNNIFGSSPSPLEIAEKIKTAEEIKPVRVVQSYRRSPDGVKKYELVEGRMRYWAWLLAYGYEREIPALVR